jgi:hypothetical protein
MAEQQWTNETPDHHEEVRVMQEPGYEQRQEIVENTAVARTEGLRKITQLLWLLLGILEGLIALRIVLKFIAANPASPFANLIYSLTDLFLWPFFGLTVTPNFNGIVLEIPSIIAMIVYALITWVIVRLIWLLFDRTPTRSVSYYERNRKL